MKKLRILEFKTISPFFELCRDGQKPFDIRLRDSKDRRFRRLSGLPYGRFKFERKFPEDWAVKLINPATGETFMRKLTGWGCLVLEPPWVIMYLGEIIA